MQRQEESGHEYWFINAGFIQPGQEGACRQCWQSQIAAYLGSFVGQDWGKITASNPKAPQCAELVAFLADNETLQSWDKIPTGFLKICADTLLYLSVTCQAHMKAQKASKEQHLDMMNKHCQQLETRLDEMLSRIAKETEEIKDLEQQLTDGKLPFLS